MNVLCAHQVTPRTYGALAHGYSGYKYGSTAMIEYFGAELVTLALASVPGILSGSVTVTAPASRSVPIGADLLANAVLSGVNFARIETGQEPAVRAKLHRHTLPSGDYGGLGEAERRETLSRERISLIPELIRGRDVLVVDDLWVTGASAEVTIKAISCHDPRTLTYLLIGQVEPGFAAEYPRVEADLNHARVRDLNTLGELIASEPVTMTQRLCKFVLSQPTESLEVFLLTLHPKFRQNLYAAVLADGLGLMPDYAEQFAVLQGFMDPPKLPALTGRAGWTA